ncbi:uncharacterized protein LOC111083169 [Limulus polyphemus]|uniref:Uncharacterized protein LOC111083169 n=1 Tax=Limulus polyphemus TaxID=6850 RepID=A0ABM1RUX8_LIMPO|nr:uncharacterized protein LOC111083169 [Limulus polyphemus]
MSIPCHTTACSKQIVCYKKWGSDSSCSDVLLPKDNCVNLEEARLWRIQKNCVRRLWKGLQRACRCLLVLLLGLNSPQKAAFRPSSTMYPPLLLLVLFVSAVFRIAE